VIELECYLGKVLESLAGDGGERREELAVGVANGGGRAARACEEAMGNTFYRHDERADSTILHHEGKGAGRGRQPLHCPWRARKGSRKGVAIGTRTRYLMFEVRARRGLHVEVWWWPCGSADGRAPARGCAARRNVTSSHPIYLRLTECFSKISIQTPQTVNMSCGASIGEYFS
jgi:hypothetical protein